MPVEREATIKRAETLLRKGKLADAIAEYVRLVADYPRDWNTINTLGDLYVRAGEADRAVEQFTAVADHLFGEGFLPRAAALYKKALKAKPDHDHSVSRLAAIAVSQGLTLDAKAYLRDLSRLRASRGDDVGMNESEARLAALTDGAPEARRHVEAEPDPVVAPPVSVIATGADATTSPEAMSSTPADLALARLDQAIESGDEKQIREAQADLCDIYLEARLGVEARILAADLVAQEPESLAHVERLKWAHELLGTSPPESLPDPVADLMAFEAAAPESVIVTVATEAPAEAPPLEAIFEQLRADVAREHRDLAAEQYERGVKKMEQGNLAEAIKDLEAATRTPVRRFAASASLGRKLVASGELRAAVEWLDQAAESLPPNAAERRSLLLDLADTLERLGENERALSVLNTLQQDAGDYADVRDRVARLSSSQPRSSKA